MDVYEAIRTRKSVRSFLDKDVPQEVMTRLLEAVKVSLDGKTVTVEFRGPPDDVSKLIEEAWKKQLKPK